MLPTQPHQCHPLPQGRGKPLKTLFLIPSLGQGGAEAQLVELVNGLDRNRIEPFLISFEEPLDRLPDLRVEQVSFQQILRHQKFDLNLVRKIAHFIRRHDINLIHGTLQIAILTGWLARYLSGRRPPLIGAVHTTIARNRRDDLWERLLYRYVLARCQTVIFVCEEQKKYWEATYGLKLKNAVVVHNGIDVEKFSSARRDWDRDMVQRCGLPASARTACCIARFSPEKGHRYLVEAFKLVRASRPDLHLLLAGDGPERPAIERLMRESNQIKGHIHFLGAVADVRPVLEASQFLVIPSTAVETFSMAMLEAMSMERPVLATDIGGAREAVLHGYTGLLVPPGDVGRLAAAMEVLCAEPELAQAMGKNARDLVLSRFSRRIMIEKTTQVLAATVDRCG